MRQKTTEKPKESVENIRLEQNKETKFKVISTPTGVSQVKTISIYKHSLASSEEEQKMDNYPNEEYSFDRVKVLWRQYAAMLKEAGQATFCAVLTNSEPIKLEGDQFGIQVQSELQANMIKDQLLEMTNHFRKELKNYRFGFELVIVEVHSSDVQFKNGHDKFKALVQKNPTLESFRRMFDLDIEY